MCKKRILIAARTQNQTFHTQNVTAFMMITLIDAIIHLVLLGIRAVSGSEALAV